MGAIEIFYMEWHGRIHLAFYLIHQESKNWKAGKRGIYYYFLKKPSLWEKSLASLSGDVFWLSDSQILNIFLNIKLLSYELLISDLWKAGTGFYLYVSPAPILGPNLT